MGLFHRHTFSVVDVISSCERGTITATCPCGKVKHTVLHDVNKGDDPWHTWGEWEYSPGENIKTYRGLEYSRTPCMIKERICKDCKEKETKRA